MNICEICGKHCNDLKHLRYHKVWHSSLGKISLKGYSYDEIYGKQKSEEIKKKISLKYKKPILSEEKKEEMYLKISNSLKGRIGRIHSEEDKRKISESMKKRKCGGYREGSGRCKHIIYESIQNGIVKIQGTYEHPYVKWLDKNNMKWKKNLIKFPYEYLGKQHTYTPDFYLIETDEYIEIKGYKTDKDDAKWSQFPYKLSVLFKNDLEKITGDKLK